MEDVSAETSLDRHGRPLLQRPTRCAEERLGAPPRDSAPDTSSRTRSGTKPSSAPIANSAHECRRSIDRARYFAIANRKSEHSLQTEGSEGREARCTLFMRQGRHVLPNGTSSVHSNRSNPASHGQCEVHPDYSSNQFQDDNRRVQPRGYRHQEPDRRSPARSAQVRCRSGPERQREAASAG